MPTPVQNITNAIAAYDRSAKGGSGLESREAQPGGEFSDLVKGAIGEAIKIGEQSEQLSLSAVNGQANLNEVVTAVAEAEIALQTVISIRDKVVEAYQQIIRMPI